MIISSNLYSGGGFTPPFPVFDLFFSLSSQPFIIYAFAICMVLSFCESVRSRKVTLFFFIIIIMMSSRPTLDAYSSPKTLKPGLSQLQGILTFFLVNSIFSANM